MLEIKNVYKTFNAGTINEKKALNDLNLVPVSYTHLTLPTICSV